MEYVSQNLLTVQSCLSSSIKKLINPIQKIRYHSIESFNHQVSQPWEKDYAEKHSRAMFNQVERMDLKVGKILQK